MVRRPIKDLIEIDEYANRDTEDLQKEIRDRKLDACIFTKYRDAVGETFYIFLLSMQVWIKFRMTRKSFSHSKCNNIYKSL